MSNDSAESSPKLEMEGDWFVSLPDSEKHSKFLNDVIKLLLDEAVFRGTRKSEPVTKWVTPKNLTDILNCDPPDLPKNEEDLLQMIKQTIAYSVKTGHPFFMNQLFSGLDPYGLAGQWVTDALNSSVYTYEVAPVFTIMEQNILKKMRSLIGWENGDGIFCPGGSIANGIGMNLGRFYLNNDIKQQGITGLFRLVAFASCDAHYSLKKMAAFLGIGENNIILVDTDEIGRMDAIHLKQCIEMSLKEGAVPFAVIATSGTTVLGAFDPLSSIADICNSYHVWLHVDAAWGGGLLFSKSHRSKLDGIERADSVTVNPHKLLAVPQQCSLLLTRHPNYLTKCHATHASYLFQPDKFYDTSYDCGDSHIQCGRRPDVFKFWLMWMAKGSVGFERHVDSIIDTSKYFQKCVKERNNFKLVAEPQYINTCFWFVPPSLDSEFDLTDENFKSKLHKIAPAIKERMIRKGNLMLSYQPLHDKPNFFRFVTQNSALKFDDVDFILDEIELLGNNL